MSAIEIGDKVKFRMDDSQRDFIGEVVEIEVTGSGASVYDAITRLFAIRDDRTGRVHRVYENKVTKFQGADSKIAQAEREGTAVFFVEFREGPLYPPNRCTNTAHRSLSGACKSVSRSDIAWVATGRHDGNVADGYVPECSSPLYQIIMLTLATPGS